MKGSSNALMVRDVFLVEKLGLMGASKASLYETEASLPLWGVGVYTQSQGRGSNLPEGMEPVVGLGSA